MMIMMMMTMMTVMTMMMVMMIHIQWRLPEIEQWILLIASIYKQHSFYKPL